jgi:hypothetical protein
MNSKQLAELKKHFREWSGGWSPESMCEITVYVDYAMRTDLGTEDEVREALIEWIEADDPDDDIYKPGDVRHTQAEFYNADAMRNWRKGDG